MRGPDYDVYSLVEWLVWWVVLVLMFGAVIYGIATW